MDPDKPSANISSFYQKFKTPLRPRLHRTFDTAMRAVRSERALMQHVPLLNHRSSSVRSAISSNTCSIVHSSLHLHSGHVFRAQFRCSPMHLARCVETRARWTSTCLHAAAVSCPRYTTVLHRRGNGDRRRIAERLTPWSTLCLHTKGLTHGSAVRALVFNGRPCAVRNRLRGQHMASLHKTHTIKRVESFCAHRTIFAQAHLRLHMLLPRTLTTCVRMCFYIHFLAKYVSVLTITLLLECCTSAVCRRHLEHDPRTLFTPFRGFSTRLDPLLASTAAAELH